MADSKTGTELSPSIPTPVSGFQREHSQWTESLYRKVEEDWVEYQKIPLISGATQAK